MGASAGPPPGGRGVMLRETAPETRPSVRVSPPQVASSGRSITSWPPGVTWLRRSIVAVSATSRRPLPFGAGMVSGGLVASVTVAGVPAAVIRKPPGSARPGLPVVSPAATEIAASSAAT